MPLLQVELTFANINTSAQVGDAVYYTIHNASAIGGFQIADMGQTSNTYYLGLIVSIVGSSINVQFNNDLPPGGTGVPPAGAELHEGCLISFVKNKNANTSSLLGYYAEVEFVNDDGTQMPIELFSVGSEISESSK